MWIRVYIPIELTLDVVDTLCIVEVFDCKGGGVWCGVGGV